MTTARDSFSRTSCNCEKCSAFCKDVPGFLVPGDLKAIALFLGKTVDDIKDKFRASIATKVMDSKGEVRSVPTIVPDLDDNGHCVFLQEDGLCSIHEASPYGCAVFDEHMSDGEAENRLRMAIRDIGRDMMAEGLYFRTWNELANEYGPVERIKKQDLADINSVAVQAIDSLLSERDDIRRMATMGPNMDILDAMLTKQVITTLAALIQNGFLQKMRDYLVKELGDLNDSEAS